MFTLALSCFAIALLTLSMKHFSWLLSWKIFWFPKIFTSPLNNKIFQLISFFRQIYHLLAPFSLTSCQLLKYPHKKVVIDVKRTRAWWQCSQFASLSRSDAAPLMLSSQLESSVWRTELVISAPVLLRTTSVLLSLHIFLKSELSWTIRRFVCGTGTRTNQSA